MRRPLKEEYCAEFSADNVRQNADDSSGCIDGTGVDS